MGLCSGILISCQEEKRHKALCSLHFLHFFSISIFTLTSCSFQNHNNRFPEVHLPQNFVHHAEDAVGSDRVGRISYIIQSGQIPTAIQLLIQEHDKDPYLLHYSRILEDLGLSLIHQGALSSDPAENMLSLYGAALSHNERVLPFILPLLKSEHPEITMIALHVLASMETEEADRYIENQLASPYIIIRLEAAYLLAIKKHPHASTQIASLMAKLDSSLTNYFPFLLALDAQPESINNLKRLMTQSDAMTRVQAILAAASFQRDDLTDCVRIAAQSSSPQEQEAAAYALYQLGDYKSQTVLSRLSQCNYTTTALAAHYALYQFGHIASAESIAQLARQDNLFALALLAKVEGYQELLIEKMNNPSLAVRINATLSLLSKKDERSLKGLWEILLYDPRDIGFLPLTSPGGTISCWEAIPSSSEQFKKQPLAHEMTLQMKENILRKIREVNEPFFLTVAQKVLESKQNELVPLTVNLLENVATFHAHALLESKRHMLGAPLVRQYCNLSLYRATHSSVYTKELLKELNNYKEHEVLQIRPYVPWQYHLETVPFSLTLQEKSQWLVESYEALSAAQNEQAIHALLRAIQEGNSKNRALLGGLLIRCAH